MNKAEQVNDLIRNLKEVDTNQISDGYHTFGELYDHRIALFITLCKFLVKSNIFVWKSHIHSNGSEFKGWFVMGINTEAEKQITYHLPDKDWDKTNFEGIAILQKAPEWDGHGTLEVLQRLEQL